MTSKPTQTGAAGSGPMSVLNLGKEQTEAMLGAQNELLAAYEQANRAWLDRVKTEVELWSGLATRLAGTRTMPEAMQAYQESVSKRMQLAAEDARRLTEECQKLMQKVGGTLGKGWPIGGA